VSSGATIASATGQKVGPGVLVLVVGPSGAGKDTLLGVAQQMLASDSSVMFPRRSVTREASAFENNETVTPADFDRAVDKGAYALWWRAHEQGYGISRTIDDEIRLGRVIVINVSRTIIGEARQKYQRTAVVLITAPADVLAERLAGRKRDSDGDLGKRLQRASLEMEDADLVISNVGAIEDNARELANFITSLRKT
jgi:ribose 1,5-bisphosphokinase